ncbi:hypothetical protein CVV38_04550 [Candidatus Peregrinibacteria bacterium HGW-Peregrinibacteria-1]|jgi:transcriptional regulator of heat shock response|nr:MAG: hypothetical protein CVV38_04550 [Candidatus Peregrinibacteria bacterium HGW-Peregrinibacteria-1]
MTENRKKQVLDAIVKHFIDTAEPVGSKTIILSYRFNVSPATIRNDMASLEKSGLIYQPHTSSGRVPTDKGYRLFVDEIADYAQARTEALKSLEIAQNQYQLLKTREHLHEAVSILASTTNLVSFSTLPDNPRTFFLGMSNVLREPEFIKDSIHASEVMEVLERSDNFINLLNSLNIDSTAKTFIGEENILSKIQSCSIIVTTYRHNDHYGYLGLLGPKRMNYAYNIVMVEEVKKLLETQTN